MSEIKLIGNIIKFNPDTNELTYKVGFLTPEKLEAIEQILQDKENPTSIIIKKGGVKEKTYPQLKKYFHLLKEILKQKDIPLMASNIKTLDTHIKKSMLRCEILYFEGKRIPIIPSKADLSVEQMSTLIQDIITTYKLEDSDE